MSKNFSRRSTCNCFCFVSCIQLELPVTRISPSRSYYLYPSHGLLASFKQFLLPLTKRTSPLQEMLARYKKSQKSPL